MAQHSKRLILFTRYPTPGVTKTRLIPELGEQGAAKLQRRMTERMVNITKALAKREQLDIYIYFSDGSKEQMQSWLGAELFFIKQQDGDIGNRMAAAFADALNAGAKQAVLIGCDIPEISENILLQSFKTLEQNDAVIGPTLDGGYYLIGLVLNNLSVLNQKLFTDIPWSTDMVYETTTRRIKEARAHFTSLEKLQDIDRPDDLVYLPF